MHTTCREQITKQNKTKQNKNKNKNRNETKQHNKQQNKTNKQQQQNRKKNKTKQNKQINKTKTRIFKYTGFPNSSKGFWLFRIQIFGNHSRVGKSQDLQRLGG